MEWVKAGLTTLGLLAGIGLVAMVGYRAFHLKPPTDIFLTDVEVVLDETPASSAAAPFEEAFVQAVGELTVHRGELSLPGSEAAAAATRAPTEERGPAAMDAAPETPDAGVAGAEEAPDPASADAEQAPEGAAEPDSASASAEPEGEPVELSTVRGEGGQASAGLSDLRVMSTGRVQVRLTPGRHQFALRGAIGELSAQTASPAQLDLKGTGVEAHGEATRRFERGRWKSPESVEGTLQQGGAAGFVRVKELRRQFEFTGALRDAIDFYPSLLSRCRARPGETVRASVPKDLIESLSLSSEHVALALDDQQLTMDAFEFFEVCEPGLDGEGKGKAETACTSARRLCDQNLDFFEPLVAKLQSL